MNEKEQIEIDWNDVIQKLALELVSAQRDAAMRYAMCESLKRQNMELKKKLTEYEKSDLPAGS